MSTLVLLATLTMAKPVSYTHLLPRVEELFEARKPKRMAIISEIAGEVRIDEIKKNKHVIVTNNELGDSLSLIHI